MDVLKDRNLLPLAVIEWGSDLCSPQLPHWLSSSHSRGTFQWKNWPELEADHSSLSTVEIKTTWSYTSTALHVLISGAVLHTEQLFLFILKIICD
jgi:hypothetical protein